MSGDKFFFDTSILVYCFDQSDARKREIAELLVMQQSAVELGVISYQVQQEFLSVAIRKFKDPAKVRRMMGNFEQIAFDLQWVGPSAPLFNHALALWEHYSISWYGSLIVAAAIESKCGLLYTEDMQHGMEIDGMRIVNPFL